MGSDVTVVTAVGVRKPGFSKKPSFLALAHSRRALYNGAGPERQSP
jgi:hypothetical protein